MFYRGLTTRQQRDTDHEQRSKNTMTLHEMDFSRNNIGENKTQFTLGSTTLPSIVWFEIPKTCCTLLALEKVMKPKPLDLRVAGSFITITSATSPNFEKYSRTF